MISREHDTDGEQGSADLERTSYIHHDGQIVLQFEKSGTDDITASDLSNRYLWGPMVDQLLADEQIDWSNNEADGETLWALTDHLGTVRDLVDDTGTVQNHKSYDSFGNVTAETNAAVDTVFGYTGKLLDDATGLQNNLNRWYDSSVGKWISEDPIGFAAGDANLNRYVGNAVTMFVDPDGLFTISIGIGADISAGTTHGTVEGEITVGCDLKTGALSCCGSYNTSGSFLPPTFGIGGSISPQVTITNADHVDELNGQGLDQGFFTPLGGASIVCGVNNNFWAWIWSFFGYSNTSFVGIQLAAAPPIPGFGFGPGGIFFDSSNTSNGPVITLP